MFVGTIDFYYLPFSLTVNMAGVHKISAVLNLFSWLHFLTHFSTDQGEILYGVEAVQVDHPDINFE